MCYSINIKMDAVNKIDKTITKYIYNFINASTLLKGVPHVFGLVQYEIYVIPGMHLAIIQTLLFETHKPIQFHLLPHWFSYSIFQFLKKSIKRGRPGCVDKSLNDYIEPGHCKGSNKFQSFPSGHMGVASSLATALYMEMHYSEDAKFFEVPIVSKSMKNVISLSGIFVALMVGLHRISKGYHSFFDVICGFLIGCSIGAVSWKVLEICPTNEEDGSNKNVLSNNLNNVYTIYEELKKDNEFINHVLFASKIILIIPISFLIYKFMTKDLFHLTTIKH